MEIAVRYFSRNGATAKVAKAMARELGVKAETTDIPISKKVNLLFVGSGMYAGHMDKHVKAFLESLTKEQIGKVVFFGTSMTSGQKMDGEARQILERKDIPMDTRTFHCHGKFLVFHRLHPDEKDLLDAEIFAKKIGKK